MRRIYELDIFRVSAMLAVVLLHVTSGYIFAESGFSLMGMNIAFILNQAARFAVPSFVFLSGISLSLSKDMSWGAFIKKRVPAVLLPYLLWCVLYYLLKNDFSIGRAFHSGFLPGFIQGLFRGSFASHLYFIVLIIQLYLLYPLLKWLKNRLKPAALLLPAFILTFYFIQAIRLRSFGVGLIPPVISGYAWFLFPTWIFYFVCGMYLDRELLVKIFDFARRNILILLATFFCFAFFYCLFSKHQKSHELSIKAELVVYTALTFVVCCSFSGYASKLKKPIEFLSKHSTTVYFSHVFVLILLKKHYTFNGMSGMALLFAAVLLISVGIAFVIDFMVGKLARVVKK